MKIPDVDDTLPLRELAERIGILTDVDGWQARTVELAVGFMLGTLDRQEAVVPRTHYEAVERDVTDLTEISFLLGELYQAAHQAAACLVDVREEARGRAGDGAHQGATLGRRVRLLPRCSALEPLPRGGGGRACTGDEDRGQLGLIQRRCAG